MELLLELLFIKRMKKVEFDNWIIEWFEKNTIANKEELLSFVENNYFEKGWMDSFKFVSFIMDIENHFNINFSNDEFQNRDFSSIKGLAKIIRKHIKKDDKEI